MSFRVDIEKRSDGNYVVRPKGRLDMEECPHFESRVRPIFTPPPKVLVLDMDELDYISSTGLGVIFEMRNIVMENKGIFIIASLRPQIRKVFDILKVLPKEAFFANMKEADRFLDKSDQEPR